jgi:hypothetical protein
MRAYLAAVCFGGAFLFGAASWAAAEPAKPTMLEPVKGEVWINHGKGFVKVDQSIEAKVGDSIMVSPGGDAKVTYADKCETKVRPGAVVTIAPLSPCASGSLAADLTPMVTKAPPAAAPPETFVWWPLVLVAGGGAFIGCEIAGGCFQSGGSP